jgi:hypothetical protein
MDRVLKNRAAHNHLSSLIASLSVSTGVYTLLNHLNIILEFTNEKTHRIHRFWQKRMKIQERQITWNKKSIVEGSQKE